MHKTPFLAAAAFAVVALPAHALTSFSDGFEIPSIGAAPFVTYVAGNSFNGWSVGGVSVDIVSNAFGIPAAGGSQFVDLAGTLPGTISRQLALDPGQYILSFAFRGNTFDPNPPGGNYLAQVVAGIGAAVPYVASVSSTVQSWQTAAFEFTATQPQTLVSFASLVSGANGNGGVLIDNVQIAAVPEAHEWAMMLAGLGLVAAVAVRRRRATGAMPA